METLYRIEDSNGFGIYTSELCDEHYSKIRDIISKHNSIPNPHQEKNLRKIFNDKLFCSFDSKEQMFRWVTQEDLNTYIEIGFKIFEIYVSECIKGDWQNLFLKENILSKKEITYEMIN